MKSNQLLEEILMMITMMLHDLLPQVLILIVQVMAMKTLQPQPKWELVNQ